MNGDGDFDNDINEFSAEITFLLALLSLQGSAGGTLMFSGFYFGLLLCKYSGAIKSNSTSL